MIFTNEFLKPCELFSSVYSLIQILFLKLNFEMIDPFFKEIDVGINVVSRDLWFILDCHRLCDFRHWPKEEDSTLGVIN